MNERLIRALRLNIPPIDGNGDRIRVLFAIRRSGSSPQVLLAYKEGQKLGLFLFDSSNCDVKDPNGIMNASLYDGTFSMKQDLFAELVERQAFWKSYTIYFDYNSSVTSEDQRQKLELYREEIRLLRSRASQSSVFIFGHSDALNPSPDIARQRALFIRKSLHMPDQNNVQCFALAEKSLLVFADVDKTSKNQYPNRRVDIIISAGMNEDEILNNYLLSINKKTSLRNKLKEQRILE